MVSTKCNKAVQILTFINFFTKQKRYEYEKLNHFLKSIYLKGEIFLFHKIRNILYNLSEQLM